MTENKKKSMTPDEFSKLIERDFKLYVQSNTSIDGTVSEEAIREAIIVFINSAKASTVTLQIMLKKKE